MKIHRPLACLLSGPKLLTIFTALSLARDEIVWLLRHGENFPAKLQKEANKKAAGTTRDDYNDRTYPEFLFYIGTASRSFSAPPLYFSHRRGTSLPDHHLLVGDQTILHRMSIDTGLQ